MNNVQELLKQGFAELDKLDYQKALEIFQEATKLEPQNSEVLYSLRCRISLLSARKLSRINRISQSGFSN